MTKKKIMIVDDDPDILCSVSTILEKNGYKVITATDGMFCIKKLMKGEKPNLIILDIMMPILSGWDVLTKIKKNNKWRKIPIVFLTARCTDTAMDMCQSYGVDYISKPFNLIDLLDKIKEMLNCKSKKKLLIA